MFSHNYLWTMCFIKVEVKNLVPIFANYVVEKFCNTAAELHNCFCYIILN